MKKSERQFVEVDLTSIVGAAENLRDTAPRLTQQGYSMFQSKDPDHPSLMSMALSDEAELKGRFVNLIEGNESEIKELSDNMTNSSRSACVQQMKKESMI